MSLLAFIFLGLIAGFIARAIMPGRQAMGFVATTLLGMVGSILGGFIGNLLSGQNPASTAPLVDAVLAELV